MGRTVAGYSTSIPILYFSTIDLLRGIQSIEVTVPIFDVQFITIMLLVGIRKCNTVDAEVPMGPRQLKI